MKSLGLFLFMALPEKREKKADTISFFLKVH